MATLYPLGSSASSVAPSDPPQSDRERSAALLAALRGHFAAPDDPFDGRTFLTELTAPNSTRRADAVWVGLYASRGYGIDVCELKVSRADFNREIARPAKADAWWPYSSRFWVVAPDIDVAPPDRLPAGWGLLVPKARGRRFQVIVAAAERVPIVDFELMARVTARLSSSFSESLRDEHATNVEAVADVRREMHERLESAGADHSAQSRLRALETFEEVAGIRLAEHGWRDDFDAAVAGRSFRRFVAAEADRERAEVQLRRRMASLARDAETVARDARRVAESHDDVADES